MTSREQQFRHLFHANYRALVAYAVRRTSSRADAEDAVADAFTVAWRRFDDLPGDEREQRLWLYGAARRTLANRHRSNRRAERLAERVTSHADHAPPADSGLEHAADLDLALRALAQLSETDQELVRLALWEELSHAEIAKVIDTPVPNVAVRLHRAKRRLRRFFDRHVKGHASGGHVSGTRAIGTRDQESSR